MASFCKSCSIEMFDKDTGDLAGITTKKNESSGTAVIVICEGCGVIQVDHAGNCISAGCLRKDQPGHGLPYDWKGGGTSNERGKGKLFNRKLKL